MASKNQSYLIIGAGVFGVSTAYYLIKKYPNANITLVDRDSYEADTRVAASWDWNKVVRADYDDVVYCRMGIEAQDVFKSDPLWKPYFHETGVFWTCRTDYATAVIDNYKKIGRKADLYAVPVNEAKKMHNGLFDQADYSGVKEILINNTSGWAAAADCLQAVTRAAVDLGVKYVVAEVSTLQFDNSGRCTGVRLANGRSMTASHTILSTGAFTPKLLELSAQSTGRNALRADGRIVAGGINTGLTRLDDKTYETFKNMPVGMQGYPAEIGPFIGSLPPTPDKELKWWGPTIFTNTREVVPGRKISMPPAKPDYGQWDVPQRLKDDIDVSNNVWYGKKGAGWKMNKYRICWDAFTTTSDFIISPHAASKGLYVATCGSFHGWKFFPVLGKYVIQMLEGTLPADLSEKWAWDRHRPDPKYNGEYPRAEMNTVLEPTRTSRL